jgi:FkbM family methyltransferase
MSGLGRRAARRLRAVVRPAHGAGSARHAEELRRLDRHVGRLDDRLSQVIRQLRTIEQNSTRQIGRLDYAEGEILLGVTTRAELLSRLRPTQKEPWTVAWIEREMRDGDVLWDIGANVGAYGLIAAHCAPGARVVAVEPGYANYAALCDNILLNRLSDRVLAVPAVLAARTALASLAFDDVGPGSGSVHVEQAGYSEGAAARQRVLAYRLDDLVAQFGLPAPTLVKIDVEGAELDVLAGAAEALARPELRGLLVEIAHERSADVVDTLAAHGFELDERIAERDGTPMPLIWYGIFGRR